MKIYEEEFTDILKGKDGVLQNLVFCNISIEEMTEIKESIKRSNGNISAGFVDFDVKELDKIEKIINSIPDYRLNSRQMIEIIAWETYTYALILNSLKGKKDIKFNFENIDEILALNNCQDIAEYQNKYVKLMNKVPYFDVFSNIKTGSEQKEKLIVHFFLEKDVVKNPQLQSVVNRFLTATCCKVRLYTDDNKLLHYYSTSGLAEATHDYVEYTEKEKPKQLKKTI